MRALHLVLALGLGAALPALAADLTPETVAKIRLEQQQAQKRIEEAHGNKKPGEMSNEERRRMMEAQAQAEQKILQKYGVTAREFTNYTLRMDNAERAQAESAQKQLEAEAKKKEEAKKTSAATPGEVQVQRGFSEEDPVDLEESADAPPKVEYGTKDNQAAEAE